MKKHFTLGKNERLKSRKGIDQLFNEGRKIMVPPYKALYFFLENEGEPFLRFGTGVSTKNFSKAVDRNRVKRLTREAWRLQKNLLEKTIRDNQKKLHVFFLYTARELPEYKEVYDKTGIIISRLLKLAGK